MLQETITVEGSAPLGTQPTPQSDGHDRTFVRTFP